MAWVNAFGPLAFVAAAAALPWLFNPHSSLCASWLEDWDAAVLMGAADGVNFVSNPTLSTAWVTGRRNNVKPLLASLSQVWDVWSDSGVILGVFEPVALSAKVLFAGAAGFASSILADYGSDYGDAYEANDGRLAMSASWLLWWSIALHVCAALLLQDTSRRFLALLRALRRASRESLSSRDGGLAATISPSPAQTLPANPQFFAFHTGSSTASAAVESEAWSEAWATAIVAAAWAAHPLRIEVVGWLSCVPYGLAGCFAIASVRAFVMAHAAFHSGGRRREAWVSMLACRCWYLCAALCKSPALTLSLALIVLDATLGTFSTSAFATVGNLNGSNGKKSNNSDGLKFVLLQLKAALGCVGRVFDLLAVMLALIWRARKANTSHDDDHRWNELHKKQFLWAGEELSTHTVALKAAHALSAYPVATLWPKKLAMIYPVPKGWPSIEDTNSTSLEQGNWLEPTRGQIEVMAVMGSFVLGLFLALRAATFVLPSGFMTSPLKGRGGNAWVVAIGASWAASTALLLPTLGFVQHGWPVLRADRYYHIASMVWAFPAAVVLKQLFLTAQSNANPNNLRVTVPPVSNSTIRSHGGCSNSQSGSTSIRNESSSPSKYDGRSSHSNADITSKRRIIAARGSIFLSTTLIALLAMQSAHARIKWSSSLSLWSHASFVHPRDTTSYYNLACVLERLGTDLGVAEQRLTAATQAASSPTAVGNKSDATNALTAATEAYKQAAAAAGFSVELLDEQAAGYSPRKDGSSPASELLVRAEAIFQVATILGPSYGAAWNNWGQLAERRGDVASAEKGYRTAVILNPDSHYKAHNNLGQLLHRSRRYDLAEHHYRAAIEILPTYHLALFNLATLLHTTGASIQQPHSMDTRDGGVGSKASSPLSPNSRSMSWSSQEEALSLYRASIDVMPRMPEAHYNYAQLLLTLHGADKGQEGIRALATAGESLEASIALRPHHRPALETLKHVRALQKRREAAAAAK